MEGAAFIPRWQGIGGPSAAGSLLAAGSLAASGHMAGSPHRGLQRRQSPEVQPGRGWPTGYRPLFLDEIPPRLEECRERIAAVDRDLGRIGTGKGVSPVDSKPVSSDSAAREPESESSPSSRLRKSVILSGPLGVEQETEQEDMAETVSKMESELQALHESWKVIDQDRHRLELQRDSLARRVDASEERVAGMEAKVESLGDRVVELDCLQEVLRRNLGVSEADVKAQKPLVENAEKRVALLRGQSNELMARLYVSQREVEDLRTRVEMEEHEKAMLEERKRQREAEHQEWNRAAQEVAEKVSKEFEAEFTEERRAAEQRERELKLAIATMAQRSKAAEESIKRVTGEGIPEPPRWFRSAIPTMLCRRKRMAHGMVPGVPALGSGMPPASSVTSVAAVGNEQEDLRPSASSSTPVMVEGDEEEAAPAAGEADAGGEEGEVDMDTEAAALLQAMGGGMQAGVPQLLFASGLPTMSGGDKQGAGVEDSPKYLPASCKIDLLRQCMSIQVLAPTGVTHKISLVEVNSISRPEDAKGAVDVAGAPAAHGARRRLRITAPDEDGASALVAAITLPDRIIPGSALVSGRTSVAHTVVGEAAGHQA